GSQYSRYHDSRAGARALRAEQRGQGETRGREKHHQDERSTDAARNRRAEGTHDLRAAERTESRSGKEIAAPSSRPAQTARGSLVNGESSRNLSSIVHQPLRGSFASLRMICVFCLS